MTTITKSDDFFRVDEDGIYIQRPQYGENVYEQIMSKEAFIEAYNKYIKGEDKGE